MSSIRRTKVPPVCWAMAQLNRAERAPPTWNMPVGEGAKRTRTFEETGEEDMDQILVPTGGDRRFSVLVRYIP
ncbi:hypothetical protein GCM10022221_34560 [Actinocorallia aurea]